MFINDGKANFSHRATECGLTQADAYLMPTAIDYDRDGDLDLFLVSNQLYHPDGQPSSPPFEPGPDRRPRVKKEWERYMALTRKPDGKYTMDTVGRPDLLIRNDSKGRGCNGEVGAVFALEASRRARNNRDWHHLIDVCVLTRTLVVDADGIYDPRQLNDRPLLGLKGIMSEFELGLLRQRAPEAYRQKAMRGEVMTRVPVALSARGITE